MNSIAATSDTSPVQLIPNVLREATFDPNMIASPQRCKKFVDEKPIFISGDPERIFGLPPHPCVASTARRAALGWSKRSIARTGPENKENNTSLGNVSLGRGLANVLQGITMS